VRMKTEPGSNISPVPWVSMCISIQTHPSHLPLIHHIQPPTQHHPGSSRSPSSPIEAPPPPVHHHGNHGITSTVDSSSAPLRNPPVPSSLHPTTIKNAATEAFCHLGVACAPCRTPCLHAPGLNFILTTTGSFWMIT